ncbi:MAG: hypothetical protein H0U78_04185 [Rickettsiaceae bacterium]|jgi:tetratricopeptide (TPR) repeat protein|nr:hypothetical protein [Rickettsiaceae bacterium]
MKELNEKGFYSKISFIEFLTVAVAVYVPWGFIFALSRYFKTELVAILSLLVVTFTMSWFSYLMYLSSNFLRIISKEYFVAFFALISFLGLFVYSETIGTKDEINRFIARQRVVVLKDLLNNDIISSEISFKKFLGLYNLKNPDQKVDANICFSQLSVPTEFLLLSANIFSIKKDYEGTTQCLNALLSLDLTNTDIKHTIIFKMKAQLLLEQNKLIDALGFYETVLAEEPRYQKGWLATAIILKKLGRENESALAKSISQNLKIQQYTQLNPDIIHELLAEDIQFDFSDILHDLLYDAERELKRAEEIRKGGDMDILFLQRTMRSNGINEVITK